MQGVESFDCLILQFLFVCFFEGTSLGHFRFKGISDICEL